MTDWFWEGMEGFAEYNGTLYAAILFGAVFAYRLPVGWGQNVNFDNVLSYPQIVSNTNALVVYDGKLYAGLQVYAGHSFSGNPPQVWEFDGTSWSFNHEFTTFREDPRRFIVYGSNLYMGTFAIFPEPVKIYKYDGVTWSLSTTFSTDRTMVQDFALFGGDLYAAIGNGSNDVDTDIYSFDGATWTLDHTFVSMTVCSLYVFNSFLYAYIVDRATSQRTLWRRIAGVWTFEINLGGPGEAPASFAAGFMIVYHSRLFISTETSGDVETFIYDGISAVKDIQYGLSPPRTYGEATPWGYHSGNDNLYIATRATGIHSQVWTYPDVDTTPTSNIFSEAFPLSSIPDPGSVSDTINVSTVETVAAIKIHVEITHDYVGDVKVELTSPSLTVVTIVEDLTNNSIATGVIAFFTNFSVPAMQAFVGEPTNGDWTLTVTDTSGNSQTGTFISWAVYIWT